MALMLASQVLVGQIQKQRKQQRLSQEALAKRMTHVGFPMGQTTVSTIEAGRRYLLLDEAVAFAAVLGVSLVSLLTPEPDDRLVIHPYSERGAESLDEPIGLTRAEAVKWLTETRQPTSDEHVQSLERRVALLEASIQKMGAELGQLIVQQQQPALERIERAMSQGSVD
jgi:transcriptional regulator with XRE-family HTH domain